MRATRSEDVVLPLATLTVPGIGGAPFDLALHRVEKVPVHEVAPCRRHQQLKLFWRELERAVRGVARELPAESAQNTLDLLSSFLQQARHVSMRAFRMASRAPRAGG